MAKELTARERVLKALNYEEPDRIPIDVGASRDSSLVKDEYDLLRKYLKLPPSDPPITSLMMRTVDVDEDVLEHFDIDFRGVYPGSAREMEWIDERTYRDEWNVVRVRPEGSYYFDLRESPLSGDITVQDIANYPWPDPDAPSITAPLKDRVRELREKTDKALVLALPAPMVHISQYIRGFEDWFMDCAANIKIITALFDAVLEVNMQMAKNELEAVGKDVDIAICGDDMGTQSGLQFHPDFFREHLKPRFKKYFDQVHSLAPNIKMLFHSCGSIEPILDDLIEIGVDIINPVQVAAKDMDSAFLNKKYGGRVCFWGAIDTQYVLCSETPEGVKKEVERRINDFGKGGGYVVSAVHNIQPGVPPENIEAMFEHAKEYSRTLYGNT